MDNNGCHSDEVVEHVLDLIQTSVDMPEEDEIKERVAEALSTPVPAHINKKSKKQVALGPRYKIHLSFGCENQNLLEKVKYEAVRIAYEKCNRNKTRTARVLGVSVRSVQNYLKPYEVES